MAVAVRGAAVRFRVVGAVERHVDAVRHRRRQRLLEAGGRERLHQRAHCRHRLSVQLMKVFVKIINVRTE